MDPTDNDTYLLLYGAWVSNVSIYTLPVCFYCILNLYWFNRSFNFWILILVDTIPDNVSLSLEKLNDLETTISEGLKDIF